MDAEDRRQAHESPGAAPAARLCREVRTTVCA